MAAVERLSPLISTMSPGFKSNPMSADMRARPCPTSDGMAFDTRNETDSSLSDITLAPQHFLLAYDGI